jgi:hypothetical protein
MIVLFLLFCVFSEADFAFTQHAFPKVGFELYDDFDGSQGIISHRSFWVPPNEFKRKRSEPIHGRRRQLLLLAHRARTNLDVIFGALSVVVSFLTHHPTSFDSSP